MIDVDHAQAASLLSIAVRDFEGLFPRKEMGLPQRYSQTGEEYVEFSNDGLRTEGEANHIYDFVTDKRVPGRTIHQSAQTCVQQWLKEVEQYARQLDFDHASSTLYWRIKPEIDLVWTEIQATNGVFVLQSWQIYSRFLISDKPKVQLSEVA